MRFQLGLPSVRTFAPAVALIALLLPGSTAQASLIQPDSTYTIQGTNAPDTFGPVSLLFDGTTKSVDGGALNVTEMQVATAGGGEWDIFSVATANGGPLAGNINAYWSLGWGFTLSQPSLFDATTIWWTQDGVAFDPIVAFGSICCPETNPINPAWGPAYYSSFPGSPFDGFVTFNPTIFASPYSFIASGGIDPSTANGFNFAFHFTPAAATPEPASLLLLGSGIVALWRRKR